jgi:hypothetical protein
MSAPAAAETEHVREISRILRTQAQFRRLGINARARRQEQR